jgi:hypothetical protein
MTDKTTRTEIEMPDVADFYTHSRAVRREAEIARSLYFAKMVNYIAAKIAHTFRSLSDVLSFTQRMNQNVRL